MNYNLYVRCFNGQSNLFDLPKEKLEKVLLAYLKGDSKFTLSGKTYYFGWSVNIFNVYENHSGYGQKELEVLREEHGERGFLRTSYFFPRTVRETRSRCY